MKTRLLSFLICPSCKEPNISLESLEMNGEEVFSGILTCKACGLWFPIIHGVPRMLSGDLKSNLVLLPHEIFLNQYKDKLSKNIVQEWESVLKNAQSAKKDLKTRTAQSFGYEWTTFPELCESYKKNFLDYVDPLQENFFQNKILLDAGCGMGRHTYWAAKFGAQEVIGIDLSQAVEASYKNAGTLPNVHIVQGDIYHLPFKNPFDYVMSIGVLHHLPDPEKGFQSLVPHLKPGGTISIWVYGKRHNFFHVYFNETIRMFTRRLPFGLLHALCYVPAVGVELCNQLYRFFQRFRITLPLAQLVPFKVYAQFPFIVKVNDAFDVFSAPRSTFWKKEEIEAWYNRVNIQQHQVTYLRKKSLKAYGKKPN